MGKGLRRRYRATVLLLLFVIVVIHRPARADLNLISLSPYQLASNVTDEQLQPTTGVESNLGTFDIIINPGAELSGNAAAMAAFNRAANRWEAYISDPVTINVDANLEPLGAGILGSPLPVYM